MSATTLAPTLSRNGGTLLTAGLVGGTLLLALAGAGAVLRPVFPLLSLLLGGYFLLGGRRAALLELCIWLFMVAPGIRRIVDSGAGWDEVNILLLAPYMASAWCVVPALGGLFGRRFPYSFPFLLILLCVVYALVLALFGGRVFAGVFDAIKWFVPPCVGLMVALEPDRREEYRDVAVRSLLLACVGLGAYGIYQYLFVPPWDAFWMNNVQMNSIGTPEPFKVRVFSLLNSPGSFATIMMIAVMMVLPARSLLRWPALGLAMAALLLSIVRAAWLGTALGFAFLLVAARGWRVRGSIAAAVLVAGVALTVLSQVPEVSVMLEQRLDSMTSLAGDASAVDRSNGYQEFFDKRLGKYPFGLGLAINGAFASYADGGEATVIDGAVIEIGTAMGAVAGILYFASVTLLAGLCVWAGIGAADGFTSGCAAAVAATFTLLISGTVTVGEMGFFYWLASGFCLAAARQAAAGRGR